MAPEDTLNGAIIRLFRGPVDNHNYLTRYGQLGTVHLLSPYQCYTCTSYTHLHGNTRVRFISLDLEIISLPPIYIPVVVVQYMQFREVSWFPSQLDFQCLHMIEINMTIPHRMYECPRRQITHVGQHVCQKGVRSDVERDTQSHVTGPLV